MGLLLLLLLQRSYVFIFARIANEAALHQGKKFIWQQHLQKR